MPVHRHTLSNRMQGNNWPALCELSWPEDGTFFRMEQSSWLAITGIIPFCNQRAAHQGRFSFRPIILNTGCPAVRLDTSVNLPMGLYRLDLGAPRLGGEIA